MENQKRELATGEIVCKLCGEIRYYRPGDMVYEQKLGKRTYKFCSYTCRAKFRKKQGDQKLLRMKAKVEKKRIKEYMFDHLTKTQKLLKNMEDATLLLYQMTATSMPENLSASIVLIMKDIQKLIKANDTALLQVKPKELKKNAKQK